MAKGFNQKLKLLYLTKIFMEKTDETHRLTLSEITGLLNEYDVNADRKTLYLDFDELRNFGLDILSEQDGRSVVYYLASRDFELAELKLLVDSVQSAKFITERKSRELIKKLEALASDHEAKQLHRHVIISGRVKTMNENILINVDCIHSAINNNRQIAFRYFQWMPDKKREYRKNGKTYVASPWYMIWDDENYYLVAYDSEEEIIKHYRVDKMTDIEEIDEKREGQKKLKELDIAAYSKGLFGMFGGDAVSVTLECDNEMAGVIIDRFGKDTMIVPGKDHFTAHVDVVPSLKFLSWVISLNGDVKITAPNAVVEQLKEMLQKQMDLYK